MEKLIPVSADGQYYLIHALSRMIYHVNADLYKEVLARQDETTQPSEALMAVLSGSAL